MGDVLGIIEQLDQARFRIQYLITGVEQIVMIDPDKQNLFSNQTISDTKHLTCPFLRQRDDESSVCTIYNTRPEICRIYLCPGCRSPS